MRWLVIGALILILATGVWLVIRSDNDLPTRSANEIAAYFVTHYVAEDGRIADTGNGDISHSEGQGYGLLLAEAAADQEAFDRILRWTEQHLAVRDGDLFAWRWDPHQDAITDPNNASDGDILIAWGLLRAYDRWRENSYRARARKILDAIETELLRDSTFGMILLPGAVGFEKDDGVVINLSYWIFPAFERFAREDRPVWDRVIDSGYAVASEAGFGRYDLAADWTILAANGSVAPAEGWPAEFGYNAIRVPLHACWARSSPNEHDRGKLLARYAAFWTAHQAGLSDRWSLETDKPIGWPAPSAFNAVAAMTRACADGVESLPAPAIEPEEPYYSAALKGLVSLAAGDVALDWR